MRCCACGAPVDESRASCLQCGQDTRFSVRAPDGTLYGPYLLADIRRYAAEARIVPGAVLISADGTVLTLQQAGITAARPDQVVTPVPHQHSALPGWAIVLIAVAVLTPVSAIVAALYLPHRTLQGIYGPQGAICQSNIFQLCSSLRMYRTDYDHRFPLAATWRSAVYPYVRNPRLFECPASGLGQQSYDLAPQLSGLHDSTIQTPFQTPMIYDAQIAKGGPGPHSGKAYVGFVDGHTQFATPQQFAQYAAMLPAITGP